MDIKDESVGGKDGLLCVWLVGVLTGTNYREFCTQSSLSMKKLSRSRKTKEDMRRRK